VESDRYGTRVGKGDNAIFVFWNLRVAKVFNMTRKEGKTRRKPTLQSVSCEFVLNLALHVNRTFVEDKYVEL
jgi:hypothetical protein